MANLLGHIACGECPSSDARAVYENEDGSTSSYCFSCGTPKLLNDDFTEKQLVSKASGGDWDWKEWLKQNSRKPTIDPYGFGLEVLQGSVREGVNPSTGEIQFHYYLYRDASGRLTHVKTRNLLEKDFRVMGKGIKNSLYNINNCSQGRKMLIIVEGEKDALAMRAALAAKGKKYSVVSIPAGAAGAATAIKANWDFITSHQKVIFGFDQDTPGQDAAEACARMLPDSMEAAIIKTPLKDSAEMVIAGKGDELVSAVFNAKPPKPGAIFGTDDVAKYLDDGTEETMPWPWPALNELNGGIRRGKFVVVASAPKTGKTQFSFQCATHLMDLGVKIGMFSLEDSPGDALTLIAGMKDRENYIYQDPKKGELVKMNKKIEEAVYEYSDRFIGYDSALSQDWQDIKSNLLYMVAEGCRVIFLDTLTSLIVGAERMNDLLTEIASDLANIAKTTGVTIIAFSHVNNPKSGTPHEEGGRILSSQQYGSRSVERFSHLGIGLVRNRSPHIPEEDRNFMGIDILYARRWGRQGRVVVEYDHQTGCLNQNHSCDREIIEGVPKAKKKADTEAFGEFV